MKYLNLFFWLFIGIASTFAQTDEERIRKIAPELDKRFREFGAKNHLSSVSYALVLDGRIIHESYEGLINQATQQKPDRRSVYRIASMSKSFAAVAVLQLRDAGKLRLDDEIIKYIPELKGQKYASDSPEITIRHLLTHSAGFPEDNPWGDRQLGISTGKMLAMFRQGISFSTEPGVQYEYSNMAFAMLGYIITKVSGQPYQAYIAEHVWKPLGMKDTYWDYTLVPEKQLVKGYRWLRGKFIEQPIEGNGAYGVMGGILTSTEDFCRYMAFHQQAYDTDTPGSPVLKKSSLKEMHYPWNFNSLNRRGFTGKGEACVNVSHYGYGLRLDRNCDDISMVGHSGGLPGYGSDWKILPQYGLGIVTLTNGTYGSAALLNNEILPYIVAAAGLKPRAFPASPILKQRSKELAALLPSWEKAEASGIFAENFFSDYFTDLLKEEAEAAFAKAGPIRKVHEIVAENALRGSFILEGEKANLKVHFTLSPENPPLIQAYSIRVE